MTAGEWAGLGVQTVAVAVAAFAAWQARRSAVASHKAVQELRSAREDEARMRELQRLEVIRRTVIALKNMVAQNQEGTLAFRNLQGDLRAALPPPVGTQQLIACLHLAEANQNEAELVALALSEIENVITAFPHAYQKQQSAASQRI